MKEIRKGGEGRGERHRDTNEAVRRDEEEEGRMRRGVVEEVQETTMRFRV